MPRLSIGMVAAVLAIAVGLLAGSSATAQPATQMMTAVQVGAPPDLAPALLTPTDLDGTWSVWLLDHRDDGCGVAVRLVLPPATDWDVFVFLFYDPSRDAAAFDLLQLGLDELHWAPSDGPPWDLSVTGGAAPPLTEETARARATVRRDSDVLYADIITWRRGAMAALVMTLADTEVDALPYAERQDAKLAAFLDAQPNVASAAAACRPLNR